MRRVACSSAAMCQVGSVQGNREAVKNFTIDVPAGRVVGFVGPNGQEHQDC